MALKAYQSELTLREIGGAIDSESKRTDGALRAINDADANLGGMPARYTQFSADLDAIAAANPSDAFWQQQKAQKDLLAAEFVILKNYTADLKTAADGVAKP